MIKINRQSFLLKIYTDSISLNKVLPNMSLGCKNNLLENYEKVVSKCI